MTLPWWGVLCVIIGSMAFSLVFYRFGRFDLVQPTGICIIVLVFAIVMRWKLRQHLWFWITMTVVTALHVPLILFVPWTTRWVPAFVITPIAIADLFVILLILKIVGKFIGDQTPLRDERPGSSRLRQDREV
jgi:hypothetical protein